MKSAWVGLGNLPGHESRLPFLGTGIACMYPAFLQAMHCDTCLYLQAVPCNM